MVSVGFNILLKQKRFRSNVTYIKFILLTLNEGFEVDVFSNRHMHHSPMWDLQSEHICVMVHLSLRQQDTIPIVDS